jgi:hypothetical protein
MKNKLILGAALACTLLTGCGPTNNPTTPSVEPTVDPTVEPTVEPTQDEREFRFQVIHSCGSYNGQPVVINKDEYGDLVANVRRGSTFFVMFRYSPAIITMDDIVFDIEDKTVINRVSDSDNKYLKNKFKAAGRGETTMTVYPEAEGIDSSKHTFVIRFIVS